MVENSEPKGIFCTESLELQPSRSKGKNISSGKLSLSERIKLTSEAIREHNFDFLASEAYVAPEPHISLQLPNIHLARRMGKEFKGYCKKKFPVIVDDDTNSNLSDEYRYIANLQQHVPGRRESALPQIRQTGKLGAVPELLTTKHTITAGPSVYLGVVGEREKYRRQQLDLYSSGAEEELNSARAYVESTLLRIRSDRAEYQTFTARCQLLLEQRHRVAALQRDLLSQAGKASMAPVDLVSARNRRKELKVLRDKHWITEREKHSDFRQGCIIHLEERMNAAESRRDHLFHVKLVCKKWMLLVKIAVASISFVLTLRKGYRRRYVLLIVAYSFRHWYRQTLKRATRIEELRKNLFIRHHLPAAIEGFRLRRCVKAAPLVRQFLKQYTHVMTFVVANRTFLTRVKLAQRLARRFLVRRRVQLAALTLAFVKEEQYMMGAQILTFSFPALLRECLLEKLRRTDWALFFAECRKRQAIYHEKLEKFTQLLSAHQRARSEFLGSFSLSRSAYEQHLQNLPPAVRDRLGFSEAAEFDGKARAAFDNRMTSNFGREMQSEWQSSGKVIGYTGTFAEATRRRAEANTEKVTSPKLHPSQRFRPGPNRPQPKVVANAGESSLRLPSHTSGRIALEAMNRKSLDVDGNVVAQSTEQHQFRNETSSIMDRMPVLKLPCRKLLCAPANMFNFIQNTKAMILIARENVLKQRARLRQERRQEREALGLNSSSESDSVREEDFFGVESTVNIDVELIERKTQTPQHSRSGAMTPRPPPSRERRDKQPGSPPSRKPNVAEPAENLVPQASNPGNEVPHFMQTGRKPGEPEKRLRGFRIVTLPQELDTRDEKVLSQWMDVGYIKKFLFRMLPHYDEELEGPRGKKKEQH